MNVLQLLALSALTVTFYGCAVSGPIMKVDQSESAFKNAAYSGETRLIVDSNELANYPSSEQYRVFEKSYTGYGSIPEARDQAMPRVVEFCRRLKREPKIIKEHTSVPPHILGNWPRIEIIFVCVNKSDNLKNVSSDDRYAKILQLKTLLDQKAITQEEFDKEKSNLLNN